MRSILDRLRRVPPAQIILDEMLDELRDLQRSERHINCLKWDCRSFVAANPRIERWTAQGITLYLRGISVGARRRDNIRDSLVTLSRFARRCGYLPDKASEAEKVRKIKPDASEVATWSVAETELFLEHASEQWLPCFAIGLFAGLRKSEILRLDWSALKWHHDPPVIAVHRKIARKVRVDRLAPMLPNLASWLEPYRHRVGAIYPCEFKMAENSCSYEMVFCRKVVSWVFRNAVTIKKSLLVALLSLLCALTAFGFERFSDLIARRPAATGFAAARPAFFVCPPFVRRAVTIIARGHFFKRLGAGSIPAPASFHR
jgi:integrase